MKNINCAILIMQLELYGTVQYDQLLKTDRKAQISINLKKYTAYSFVIPFILYPKITPSKDINFNDKVS